MQRKCVSQPDYQCQIVIDKICKDEVSEKCRTLKKKSCHTIKENVKSFHRFKKCVWHDPKPVDQICPKVTETTSDEMTSMEDLT